MQLLKLSFASLCWCVSKRAPSKHHSLVYCFIHYSIVWLALCKYILRSIYKIYTRLFVVSLSLSEHFLLLYNFICFNFVLAKTALIHRVEYHTPVIKFISVFRRQVSTIFISFAKISCISHDTVSASLFSVHVHDSLLILFLCSTVVLHNQRINKQSLNFFRLKKINSFYFYNLTLINCIFERVISSENSKNFQFDYATMQNENMSTVLCR